jgi:hypothetical protein
MLKKRGQMREYSRVLSVKNTQYQRDTKIAEAGMRQWQSTAILPGSFTEW